MTKKPFNGGKTKISNDELNGLPLGAFTGEVVVIARRSQMAAAVHEWKTCPIIGFDTETKPVFVKGQRNKVSLMQIALPKKVFLVRMQHTGIPDELVDFLQDGTIQKIGVGIRDDIKALQVLRRFKPAGFVELTDLTKRAGLEVESVKKLTGLVLGFRISKSAQTSNWEADHLDEKQISYAATDAWACLAVYQALQADLEGD